MKDKRELRASMKVEIVYHEGKNILTKRFPSSIEIEDFHFSTSKLLDEQERILTNEILVLMYNRNEGTPIEKVYGGNYHFNVENPPGIDIEVHMKKPDSDLRKDIGEITRLLCTKHLKSAFILPSRYYISCKIDKYKFSDEKAQIFCTDFLNGLQIKMQTYSTIKEKDIKFITPIKEVNDTKQDWIPEGNITENKSETDDAKCSFCSYITGNLTRCKYCGELFCRDHIEPKTPNDFYRTAGGHSCKQFTGQKPSEQPKKQVTFDKNLQMKKSKILGIIILILAISFTLFAIYSLISFGFGFSIYNILLFLFSYIIGIALIIIKKGGMYHKIILISGIIILALYVIMLVTTLLIVILWE